VHLESLLSDIKGSATGDQLKRLLATTKALENHLEQVLGASGKGLHEKLTAYITKNPGRISDATARQVRFVASFRNKAVHDGSIEHSEREFEHAIQTAEKLFTDVSKLGIATRTGLSDPAEVEQPGGGRSDAQRKWSASTLFRVSLLIVAAAGTLWWTRKPAGTPDASPTSKNTAVRPSASTLDSASEVHEPSAASGIPKGVIEPKASPPKKPLPKPTKDVFAKDAQRHAAPTESSDAAQPAPTLEELRDIRRRF
jgi:hypothetical protein